MKLAHKASEKLLIIRGAHAGTVGQEDLLELIQLSNEACDARKKYKQKKNSITDALRAGAVVEDGVFSARIVQRAGKRYNYETLEVR